jgi:lipoic acid synthetase
LKIDIWKLFLENILPQGTLGKGRLNVAKPKWLKVKLPIGQKYTELRGLVDKYNLIPFAPQEAAQTWENAGAKEPTFMILGNVCTFLRILRCKTGRPNR